MQCCSHPELAGLVHRLRRKEFKLTRPRRAIITALRRQHRPLTVKEIFKALGGRECDLATVYRSLHALEAAGVVKGYEFGDGFRRYEILAEGDDGHHHHLICTRCFKVTGIGECEIREMESRLSARSGFRAVTHRLEFFGVCPACQ